MSTITKESTKERILEAAGPIFAKKGFRLATIREISESAGANVAAVNYHFGDKRQLYLEVIKSVRFQRDRQFPFPSWSNETCPRQKLYDFVNSLLNRIAASQSAPWQVQLISREVLDPSVASEELIIDYFKPVFEKLLAIIDELHALGPRAATALSYPEKMRFGFSIIGQCLFYRFASGVTAKLTPDLMHKELAIEQLAQHICNFSAAGIVSFGQPCSSNSQD
jgi:TetR/AcrR family transcriptional regulator, regulator of cefoperazone and chloramphenicol sensitivity